MSLNLIHTLPRNRFRGCLLGLAIGDAIGTSVEFMTPGSFTPLNDMIGGGVFNLAPGEWTDDTSMALCLAESLVEKQAFDPIDQLERYVRWYHTGYLSSNGRCFDIGNVIRKALHRFEQTHEPFPGLTDPNSAGSGSLMRLAPVPMFFAYHLAQAIERSGDSSRTTHASQKTVDACRYFGALIVGALHGCSKDEILSMRAEQVFQRLDSTVFFHDLEPSVAEIAIGSFKHKSPPEIQGSGYVVRGLEAALWAFHHSSSFREGCLMAANLGDDADTTAAIYGQLAGAFYGEEGIPLEWRSKLVLSEMITSFADKLWESAQRS